MKKLIFLLLLLLIPIAYAIQEPRIITGQVNINTTLGNNETVCGWFTVGFEDFSQKYVANTSISDTRNVQFIEMVEVSSQYENFTKSIDTLITSNQNLKDICNNFVNDSKTYYQKYVDCSSGLGSCQASYNETIEKADKFDQCNEEKTNYKSQKDSCQSDLNACATAKTDLENKGKNNWMSYILVAGGGAFLMFLWQNRGKSMGGGETSKFQQKW